MFLYRTWHTVTVPVARRHDSTPRAARSCWVMNKADELGLRFSRAIFFFEIRFFFLIIGHTRSMKIFYKLSGLVGQLFSPYTGFA